jgi:hypothetical protein
LGRNFDLGAHAIGAGNQNWRPVPRKLVEAGETSGTVQYLGTMGSGGEPFDSLFQTVHSVQVNARFPVCITCQN